MIKQVPTNNTTQIIYSFQDKVRCAVLWYNQGAIQVYERVTLWMLNKEYYNYKPLYTRRGLTIRELKEIEENLKKKRLTNENLKRF